LNIENIVKLNKEEIKVVKSCKTTSLKVVGNDEKIKLFEMFELYNDIGAKIKNKLYSFKNDKDTKSIYSDYINAPQRGRGATTTIFTKLISDKKYKGKDSFPKKYKNCKQFPLYNPLETGYNFTTNQYHYSNNSEIHTQLKSLHECDKATNKEYIKLKKEVDEYYKLLCKEYSIEKVDKFFEFIKNLKAMGWSFDLNFQKFFNQSMLLELKKGNVIYKGNYKVGGKNKKYIFYNTTIGNIIFEHSEFWDIISDEISIKYFNVNNLFQNKKEHSDYTPITLLKAPIRICYGNNGVKFSIAADKQYAYISCKFPELNGEKSEIIHIRCAFHKFYKNKQRKSCYLDNLVIKENGKGKYICEYSINGKHNQKAELNECFLRLVINNYNWFNKYVSGSLKETDGPLKSSYFDLYFDLSLNITEPPIHNLTEKDVKNLKNFYNSAYPEIKDFDNKENVINTFVCPVDKPHNLIGIDLGQRNPFAFCVKDNNGNIIDKGHLDGVNNENYKEYIKFGNKCERVIQLIKESREYLCGDDEAISKDNYDKITEISYEQYIEYLISKRNLVNKEDKSKDKMYELRSDKNWMIRNCISQLTHDYHKLNKNRYIDNNWKQNLYWIDSIYKFISLQKTFHNFGSYYDDKNKIKINGTGKGFCSSYYKKINNINRDTFKKFSFELLPIIKKYGACIVALENLQSMRGNKLRSADDNKMYNLWPVGQLKTFLESVLAPYNVLIIEVSEQDTSQIIDGMWSYRNKDILTNGIKTVHADEQSSENIVDRALTHHTNLYSMYMVNPIDNYWVPSCIWSPKEQSGKRIRGFLTKLYGSSDVVFSFNNNKLVKSDISVEDLIPNKKYKGEYFYRINNNEWINGEVKENIVEKIEASAEVVKSETTVK
jgi:hypothetical protein